jgi:hypothetical protein
MEKTPKVGFIKPVGQQHQVVDGIRVDKVCSLCFATCALCPQLVQ